jgi:hypothetical protein
MSSYKTHSFTYSGKKPGQPENANGLTVEFSTLVCIISVDGIAPSDPQASYTVEGEGTRRININQITKKYGDSLLLRLRNGGEKAADKIRIRTFWTYNGQTIEQAMLMSLEATLDGEVIPVTAGLQTEFFMSDPSGVIKIHPGVTIEEQKDAQGASVFMINNGGGGGIKCRCPAGFTGTCSAEFKPGDSTMRCKGTCKHSETGAPLNCGFFWDMPKPGLATFNGPEL